MNTPVNAGATASKAHQYLRCAGIPIRKDEVDRIAYELRKAHPNLEGNAFFYQVLERAFKQHVSGMDCC
jgi:hypothetical protein